MSRAAATLIDVRGVWKRYSGKTVLENVSLRVRASEFVTIVGASGCGKTTFLRMLLGDFEPCEGAIEMAGEPLQPEPGVDRGVVFQLLLGVRPLDGPRERPARLGSAQRAATRPHLR